MEQIKQIIKRDGRTVDFDIDKIADAIYKERITIWPDTWPDR